MIAARQALVEGRLDRKGYGPYDIRLVRVAALAALARNQASNPQLMATVDMAPQDMATGTLADWLVALELTPGVKNAPRLRAERSEEHTSELQSLMRISYAVFCLKKKKQRTNYNTINNKQTTHTISVTQIYNIQKTKYKPHK